MIFLLLINFLRSVIAFSHAESIYSDSEQLSAKVSISAEPRIYLGLISNEEQTALNQVVANGSFEQEMHSWDRLGKVELKEENNNNWLQISHDGDSNLWQENCIKQTIIKNTKKMFLSFKYQLFSSETNVGFDQPSFVVLVDEKVIYTDSAAKNSSNSLDSQRGWINLKECEGQSCELKFCAGNSFDHQQSSWVWLDEVSTLNPILQEEQALSFDWTPISAELYAEYECSQGIVQKLFTDQPVELDCFQPGTHQVTLQLKNSKQQLLDEKKISVLLDVVQPSPPQNFVVTKENDGSHTLAFQASTDNTSSSLQYQLCCGHQKMAENSQDSICLNLPTATADQLIANEVVGFHQELRILEQNFLPTDNCQFFWLHALDAAGNISQPSPVAALENWQFSAVDSIVINEIMFNPENSDFQEYPFGEWVELINLGKTAINLDQWKLKDVAGNQVLISANNVDTNLILTDEEQPIIAPNEYLVFFKNQSALFNNTGDTLYLYDQHDQLIDQYQYRSNTDEGRTVGRLPDVLNWTNNLIASPTQPNHRLNF